ncbi:MAG TPA: hypothetical protein VN848_08960, partial [Gemmatimonadales bacterium]|nr:hypothetical protein [Gemmatimonadales bacterium]
LVATPLAGQGVLVAPHAVYIDHARRTGVLTLYNPNPDPAEVSISTAFGYPVTDSLGHFALRTPDQPDSAHPSAATWIQAYPRRLLIAPLERQTVRLLATPPSGLPDGEYWARLIITARGGKLPVASTGDTATVRVQLDLVVNTNIGISYRKGPMTTGLAVSQLRTRTAGDSLQVWSHLERQGTAAYVGTAHVALVDSAGQIKRVVSAPIAVYVTMDPCYALSTAGLPPGRYRIRYEFLTQRDDLDPSVVLRAPPVRDSLDVHVP